MIGTLSDQGNIFDDEMLHISSLHYTGVTNRMDPQTLIRMVSASLTPDLLRPKYREEAKTQCREYGHCYIATEALWHLLGGPKSGYTPRYAFDCEDDTHWWLAHSETQSVLDPTAPQYTAKERKKLYAEGKPCGFLTRKPSKRAQVIMDRVAALGGITLDLKRESELT